MVKLVHEPSEVCHLLIKALIDSECFTNQSLNYFGIMVAYCKKEFKRTHTPLVNEKHIPINPKLHKQLGYGVSKFTVWQIRRKTAKWELPKIQPAVTYRGFLFLLKLTLQFLNGLQWYNLEGEKKVKNRTVPIFCKLIKLWSTTQCTLSQMCFSDSVHSFPQSGSRLRFYIPYNAALVSFARFQRLLPRISFWNRDFKVLLVIKNEKQRYLILFLKAHQKEQLWL